MGVQQPGQLIAGRAGLIADPQAAGFGEAANESTAASSLGIRSTAAKV